MLLLPIRWERAGVRGWVKNFLLAKPTAFPDGMPAFGELRMQFTAPTPRLLRRSSKARLMSLRSNA